MIHKQPSARPGKVLVTFRVDSSVWADRINLAGDFNNWDLKSCPLIRTSTDPDWHVTVELDWGQRYSFGYIVDGHEWRVDSHADEVELNSGRSMRFVVSTNLDRLPALAANRFLSPEEELFSRVPGSATGRALAAVPSTANA
jgi:hypothetical protein